MRGRFWKWGSFVKKPCILCIGLSGESVFLQVDHLARPGETLAADRLFREPGGKAYNQAVAAAKLGAESRLITALGRDGSGQSCLERLQKEGVKTRCFLKECATAYAAIHTASDGENTVTVFAGASACLTAEDIRQAADAFTGADFLLLTCELPREALLQAFVLAKEQGVPVLLNPAPYHLIAKELLQEARLITPNQGEAVALFGLSSNASLEQLAQAAIQTATPTVITLGARGALLCADGRSQLIAAPCVQAVDTTGAGDAFSAALAVRQALGESLSASVSYAVRYAAQTTLHAGVLDSYPFASEINEGM